MVTAAETNNTSYVRTLERDLIIPNYTRWFVDTFGAEAGQRLAVDYAILIKQAETPEGLLSLAKVVQRDFTPIEVSRIDDPSDSNATGLQRKALLARRKPIALYTVELRGFSFWSFVYVDGAFRIAGKMQALSD